MLPDFEGELVAWDTETSGLFVDDGARLSIVSVAWVTEAGEMRSYVFPFDQGTLDKTNLPKGFQGDGLFGSVDNLDVDSWWFLCDWLAKQRLVAHNAKFDSHMMAAGLRSKPDTGVDLIEAVAWDTQIGAALLDPLDNSQLKAMGQRLSLLGPDADERIEERRLKEWLRNHCPARSPRYDLAPWDVVGPYAAVDAELTVLAALQQMERIECGELSWQLIEEQFDLMATLYRMEERGVGYDVEAAAQEAGKVEDLRDLAKAKVQRIIGARTVTEPGIRSFWFGHSSGSLGLEPVEKTERGSASVAAPVVRVLAERGVPAAVEWQQFQAIDTAYTMWYGTWWKLCGEDGRLRCNYHQTKQPDERGRERGTVSGRLAVERVQLQAVPHDYQIPDGIVPIRRFFRAKPGHELWEFDLSQAEPRVAAAITGCKPWIEAYAAGMDAHTSTTIEVFGIEPDHSDFNARRAVGKRLVLGTLYGAGPPTIRLQILKFTGIDYAVEECERLVARFRNALPEIYHYARAAQYRAERFGFVELINGRKRWFTPYETAAHEQRKAFNAEIQGGVAVGVTDWMVEVEAKAPGILIGQVHDSLLCEIPTEQVERRCGQIARAGERIFEDWFGIPFIVDMKRWDSG